MSVRRVVKDARWARPAFLAVGLFVVFLISVPAILFRPTGIEWATWWPAVGVAVGVTLRVPRDRVGVVLAALTATFIVAQLTAGRELTLAFLLGLAAGAEVAVAHWILRGARDRPPELVRFSDLAALFGAAVAGATVLTLIATPAVGVLVSPEAAWDYLQTSVPAHAVGILVVTPLFFQLGRSRARERPVEFVVQWLSVLGTLALVAAAGSAGLPIAFILLGPLVWGAARIGGQVTIIQFLAIMALASELAGDQGGLIAVDGIPPETSALMVQLFVLSSGIVVVAVMALASSQRRTLRLSSEAISASLTGFAELEGRGGGWTVTAVNDAARHVLGPETRRVDVVFEDAGAQRLVAMAEGSQPVAIGASDGRVRTREGHTLQAAVAPLLDPDQERRGDVRQRFSLQVIDITDSLRVAQAEAAELLRAAEVQRALLPVAPPQLVGWEVAGACRPSRDVGGDFFDWSLEGSRLSLTLGDVMGKGIGAGMMAASMRMALRQQSGVERPGDVMTRAAQAVAEDLSRASTFVTLFHGQVDTPTGLLRYADAGHGLSIIVRSAGGYVRLESVHLPLGIDSGEVWKDAEAQLEPGDLLLSMSDGVLDVFEDADDPLHEIAEIARAAGAADDVVDALAALATEQTVVDDITIVAVRRSAT